MLNFCGFSINEQKLLQMPTKPLSWSLRCLKLTSEKGIEFNEHNLDEEIIIVSPSDTILYLQHCLYEARGIQYC